jgi:5'-3' exonuclease
MGIPLLNKLIRDKCRKSPDAIRQIHFSDLKGKIIAVDTSIYMYKFTGDNALIDNMYQLIMFFKQNEIIPLFIFDGTAPPEKHELLQIRKNQKNNAEIKYKELQHKLITIKQKTTNEGTNEHTNEYTNEDTNETKKEITNEMDILKKKFIRLKNSDIEEVKKLMNLCGVLYYDAEGEADQLCAKLVISKSAYACLSDDMDMFVYGCPLILRYMSLLNLTFILYDLSEILKYLNVSLHDFKQICIYSGTDYSNISNKNKNNKIDLYKTFNYYEKYISTQNTIINSNDSANDDSNSNDSTNSNDRTNSNDSNSNDSNSNDSNSNDSTNDDSNHDKNKENNKFSFYDWLKNNIETDNYNESYLKLIKIYNMFSVDNLNISHYNVDNDTNQNLKKKYICKGPIREFLKRYNFIFTV